MAGYVFILPWLIGFFTFTLIPILVSFWFSFTDFDLLSAPVWNNGKNFIRMFTKDTKYWKSLGVTFYFVFAGVPIRIIFALAVAILLNKKAKGIGFYRSLFYLPSLLGGSVAVAIIWRQIFSNDGILNTFLAALHLGGNIRWLGNTHTAIWTIISLSVWQFGSSMLIFLAGLKNISGTYYEAAVVDGANSRQKFLRITLPLLSPVIFFNLVMQMINAFKTFTECYVITKGGPMDSTLVYALYLYRRAFEYFDMGYSSAMAWILLLIIAFFTFLTFKSSSSWVYYESKKNV